MSNTPRTPTDAASDELILAAVERAERHRAREHPGVPFKIVVAHLGLRPGAWTTRRLRPQFETLESTGFLKSSRRHGIVVWQLTSRGRQRIALARRAGTLAQLPESPQHIAWRKANTAAAEQIEEFRDTLRNTLAQAAALFERARPADSDAWFEIGERLQQACRRVGSATHCLHEWAEPTDEHADINERSTSSDQKLTPVERAQRQARRIGRRNITL